MEVGKTDTEGGPVVGREHREEVVDRRTVSKTHKHATESKESHTHTHTEVWKQTNTPTHTMYEKRAHKNTQRETTSREKRRENSGMSKCGFTEPKASLCQVSVRIHYYLLNVLGKHEHFKLVRGRGLVEGMTTAKPADEGG